ncbi:MAG: imidazolonepropionase [Phototrophicales bacterium]
MFDLIIKNAAQVVTCAAETPKRGTAMLDVGIIHDGAVVIHEGKIIAVDETEAILAHYRANRVLDATGKTICPGFVDPHTHVVYAGNRLDEFEMRIKGATYMEIMAAGGGIIHTMRAVRQASVDDLVAETRPRLDTMLRHGTTTVEIKSGYGLDTESELKMLQAIETLDRIHPIDIVPTFLGAHAIPPGLTAEAYTEQIIHEMIPAVMAWFNHSHFEQLCIDVFCEKNAFNPEQTERILRAGKTAGMGVKAHVDEFNALGGLDIALRLDAVSVDHLDVTPVDEIKRLAQTDTIGIVIPTVNFNLGSTQFADARAIIDMGGILALTTDINPGSAPCPSMPFVMALACRYQRLLPAEALNASTINAAYSIGMGDRVGSIQVGKQADLLILNTRDYRHLMYEFGGNLVQTIIKNGVIY